jgi:hypothetical protein
LPEIRIRSQNIQKMSTPGFWAAEFEFQRLSFINMEEIREITVTKNGGTDKNTFHA